MAAIDVALVGSHLVAATATGILTIYALRRPRKPVTSTVFAALTAAFTIWTLGSLVRLFTTDPAIYVMVTTFKYVGVATSPVWFLLLAVTYGAAEPKARRLRRLAVGLLVIPLVSIVLLATTLHHGLFYTGFSPTALGDLVTLSTARGPAFWAFAIYGWGLLAVGTALLGLRAVQRLPMYRVQSAVVMVAIAVPWIASLSYILADWPHPATDPTPLAFGAASVLFGLALFRIDLVELVAQARAEVFDQTEDPVLVLDERRHVVDANPAADRLLDALGIDRDTPWAPSPFPGADGDGEAPAEGTVHLEVDGRERTYRCRWLPFGRGRGAGGAIQLVDLTEEHRLLADLRATRTDLQDALSVQRSVLDATADGILVVDGNGRIVSYNDRFQEMWSIPDEVLEARDDDAAVDFVLDQLQDPGAFLAKIEELYDQPEEESRDLLRFEDGRVYERYSRPQHLDGEVVGRVWSFHDITEVKQAQKELEEYTEKLRRSNEDLQQFAHVVSHDLQEPLRMITSYLDLTQDRYGEDLPDEASEFMDYTVEGAQRMHLLLNDLLAYSRVDSRGKEPTPTDSGAALDDALSNLEVLVHETDAEILHKDLPVVQADRSQLAELFQNLIGNAIKYTDDDVQPRVEIRAGPEGDRWRFEVSDNGIGIDPEHQKQIFTIFQRLHPRDEYEGTGAGLAICKRIVERHGGEIGVESTPGQGSTFWFSLPADGDRARSDPSPEAVEAAPP